MVCGMFGHLRPKGLGTSTAQCPGGRKTWQGMENSSVGKKQPPQNFQGISRFWSLAFSRLANCLLFNGPNICSPRFQPWDVCLSESKMLRPSQEAAKDQKLMLSQKPLEEEVEVQMPESNDQKEEIGI